MPLDSSLARAHRPVGHRAEGLGVLEQKGQIEDLEVLHPQRPELGQRGRQHLHAAELQSLQLFLVLVELAVGVELDLDLAARLGLGQLLEAQRALALGRVGRHHVAELDDDGRLGLEGQGQGEGGGKNEAAQHGKSPCGYGE
jgi:hypothetical protein